MTSATDTYIGRFAPSPTGPLHFGSLVSALAGYLDARHHAGTWLLRIEDLDPPRESRAAPEQIIAQLRGHGLLFDGEVLYQSTRLTAYQQVLDQLESSGHTYLCDCTRKTAGAIYPGTCRLRDQSVIGQPAATRLKIDADQIHTRDRLMADRSWAVGVEVGDPILRRKDSLFAYQLAVVVDDHAQAISHIVRGADLLESTPWQVYLRLCLNWAEPAYLHHPLVLGTDGNKLSKQAKAAAVNSAEALSNLHTALAFLGQPASTSTSVPELLAVAARNWDTSRIPRQARVLGADA